MRFVTPYPMLKVRVLFHETEQLANGLHRTKRKAESSGLFPEGFIAKFRPGDYTEFEKAAAYERFGSQVRRGSRMMPDMVTPAPTDWKIGTFDTSTIEDPAKRAEVERVMLEREENGRDYILVERPMVPKPWPTYDNLRSAEKIAQMVADLGLKPEDVAAYERENKDRQDVLAALGAVEDDPEKIEVNA